MRYSEAEKRRIKPLAQIAGYSSYAKAPDQFTTAPIDAIHALLKIKLVYKRVDLKSRFYRSNGCHD